MVKKVKKSRKFGSELIFVLFKAVSLLVPAYIYPTGNSATDWGALANASAQVPLVAVLNPNSGPGTAADPNYVQGVQRVQNGGGQVLGYVHTSYGARNMSAVRADIDAYLAFYPEVDGFFIDEMTNDASTASVQYYQSVGILINLAKKILNFRWKKDQMYEISKSLYLGIKLRL